MKWVDYYNRFNDLADSTRYNYLSKLENLGNKEEVVTIICALADNRNAANRLLKKAYEAKLKFSIDDIVLLTEALDEESSRIVVLNSIDQLEWEDLETLYGRVDDSIIETICEQKRWILPEDLSEFSKRKPTKKSKGGVRSVAGIVMNVFPVKKRKLYEGVENHYGYRNGRLYYGVGHTEGCEICRKARRRQ